MLKLNFKNVSWFNIKKFPLFKKTENKSMENEQENVDYDEILCELINIKDQLKHAYCVFNLQSDLDLAESSIFFIKSLEIKYNYLIKKEYSNAIISTKD